MLGSRFARYTQVTRSTNESPTGRGSAAREKGDANYIFELWDSQMHILPTGGTSHSERWKRVRLQSSCHETMGAELFSAHYYSGDSWSVWV